MIVRCLYQHVTFPSLCILLGSLVGYQLIALLMYSSNDIMFYQLSHFLPVVLKKIFMFCLFWPSGSARWSGRSHGLPYYLILLHLHILCYLICFLLRWLTKHEVGIQLCFQCLLLFFLNLGHTMTLWLLCPQYYNILTAGLRVGALYHLIWWLVPCTSIYIAAYTRLLIFTVSHCV